MKKATALFLVLIICLTAFTSCVNNSFDSLSNLLSELGYTYTHDIEFKKYIMDNFSQGGAVISEEMLDSMYEEGMKTYVFEKNGETVHATEFKKEKNLSMMFYGYEGANLTDLKRAGKIFGTIHVVTSDTAVREKIAERNKSIFF